MNKIVKKLLLGLLLVTPCAHGMEKVATQHKLSLFENVPDDMFSEILFHFAKRPSAVMSVVSLLRLRFVSVKFKTFLSDDRIVTFVKRQNFSQTALNDQLFSRLSSTGKDATTRILIAAGAHEPACVVQDALDGLRIPVDDHLAGKLLLMKTDCRFVLATTIKRGNLYWKSGES